MVQELHDGSVEADRDASSGQVDADGVLSAGQNDTAAGVDEPVHLDGRCRRIGGGGQGRWPGRLAVAGCSWRKFAGVNRDGRFLSRTWSRRMCTTVVSIHRRMVTPPRLGPSQNCWPHIGMNAAMRPVGSSSARREGWTEQAGDRLAAGQRWRDHGLVFASTLGTPLEPRNVDRAWHRAGRGWAWPGLAWPGLAQAA